MRRVLLGDMRPHEAFDAPGLRPITDIVPRGCPSPMESVVAKSLYARFKLALSSSAQFLIATSLFPEPEASSLTKS